jgi:tetratricopeptide (TPR) repeat protein
MRLHAMNFPLFILLFLWIVPPFPPGRVLGMAAVSNAEPASLFEQAGRERDGSKALRYYQTIAASSAGEDLSEEAIFRMGQYYYARGDHPLALQMFDRLRGEFSEAFHREEALFWQALSYLSLGNTDSAKVRLARVTEEDPAVHVRAQIVLGILLAKEGKYGESNICLERALKMGDNALRSTAYYQLCRNSAALSDLKSAAAYAKKLKDEFPNALETPQLTDNLWAPSPNKEKDKNEDFASKHEFTLQLGAFQNRENAENLKRKYSDTYGNTDVAEMKRDGTSLYVVRLGRFKDPKDAEEFAALELNLSPKSYKILKRDSR